MAKVYHQGKYGLSTVIKSFNKKEYELLSGLEELPKMMLETQDGKVSGRILNFKVVGKEGSGQTLLSDHLAVKLENLGLNQVSYTPGVKVDFKLKTGYTLRISKSGGSFQNVVDEDGNAEQAKTPTTAQQEDAAVWCLNNNKFCARSIAKDVGFDFDKSWNTSFEATLESVRKIKFKNRRKINLDNYDVYRDSNNKKPKFLNLITTSKYLPDTKDNWNPSDLWMVKKGYNGSDLEKKFKEMIAGKCTIYDVNELMKSRLHSGDLVGVSLKKVDASVGKKAPKLIEVNLDFLKTVKVKKVGPKLKMSLLNSYVDIRFDLFDGVQDVEYMIRFRPRSSSGILNIFVEGKPLARKTFDGAVSKAMLDKQYFGSAPADMQSSLKSKNFTDYSVYTAALEMDPEFAEFLTVKNKILDFKDVKDASADDFVTKRGFMLAYWIYLIKDIKDINTFLRNSAVSSMKMNDFSSIHYKVA